MGKYGIYFGKGDSRNVWEESHGQMTHVAARIKAVIEAVKLVSHFLCFGENLGRNKLK